MRLEFAELGKLVSRERGLKRRRDWYQSDWDCKEIKSGQSCLFGQLEDFGLQILLLQMPPQLLFCLLLLFCTNF